MVGLFGQTLKRPKRLKKGILKHIRGVFPIAGHPVGKPVDFLLVLHHELFESQHQVLLSLIAYNTRGANL